MSLGNQNKRTTRPIDTQHLEKLARQSAHTPHDPERVLLPTSKIDPAELRGLLDTFDPAGSAPPADRGMSDALMTQRMQADQFQALLQTSQAKPPSTPVALGSAPGIAVPAAESPPAERPAPRAAPRVMRHPADLQQTLARITGQRTLINLVSLALIGALVLVIAGFVLRA